MSKAIKNAYRKDPTISEKIKNTMLKKQVNVGSKNGMKKLENRVKVSKTRRLRIKENPNFFDSMKKTMRRLWSEGKWDNVNVGKCKWFKLLKKDGSFVKVQGTWELAYANWLDENNFNFDTHKGVLKYMPEDNNGYRNYFPDFYLHDLNCYVDIKCDYTLFLNADKMARVIDLNPDVNIMIVNFEDLNELGILKQNYLKGIKYELC